MTWHYSFGSFEWTIIGLIAICYLLYAVRLIHIAHKTGTNAYLAWIKLPIRGAYVALLIMAIMGPSKEQIKKEIKAVGKDIYIAVDLSQSMLAEDIQPSRLERVKKALEYVTSQLAADRIGLIIFSSQAFLQCPLTYDKRAINKYINSLEVDLVPKQGTDFEPAIRMALQKFKKEKKGSNKKRSDFMLIISDGEDFGESTAEALKSLKDEKVKLYTLGIGSRNGSRIPVPGRGYLRDKLGKEVITKLDDVALKSMAATADGKYFEISDQRNDGIRMVNAMKNEQGELRGTKQVDITSNLYFYPLMGALILILIDFTLSIRVFKFHL